MRQQVEHLLSFGVLPSEQSATVEHLRQVESALAAIVTPLSNDEACALVTLFGQDGCFGLAWSLVHLIESAPGWPVPECLVCSTNPWVVALKERAKNQAPSPSTLPGGVS